ncbi:MAG: prepilin peptidase [Alphaproteobacteria bacterium]|nr:prepilin peptidase [Alphaproteobacteria bacterium]
MNEMPPFDALWFRILVGFLIGAALGSFSTMLAYRLPRHISTVAPRSHCPSCGTTLQPRDLVPLFSWLLARGRCRYCKASIGARYFIIEVACSVAGAAACAAIGFTPSLIAALALIVALVTGAGVALSRRQP